MSPGRAARGHSYSAEMLNTGRLAQDSGRGSAAPARGWPPRPGLRARRVRGVGSAERTSSDGRSPSPRRRVQPGSGEPALPPAAGPHVVDDHRLVGDDVVGLHGQAGPGRPCPAGGLQEGLADQRAGGPDGYSSGLGAAPLPPEGRSLRSPGERYRGRAPRPITAPTWVD